MRGAPAIAITAALSLAVEITGKRHEVLNLITYSYVLAD